MNRREALKVAGVVAITAAVGAQAEAILKTKRPTKMEEQYMNRLEMKPKDPAQMDKGELKHTPLITVGGKDANGYTMVNITVGQGGIIHPSTADHWIDFIELYADGTLIGKNTLEPEISRGATAFAVKLEKVKTLKARSGCNLHGIWTSEIKL